ncbi:unknown [Orgyia pseudotsugata multiple nucleopolyhedrovirus]|uniref:Uncharacterized 37.2 kDa protein n=1 Tax=Orgyia pseudotsugata multicapsid polyhedrosis virus TaxID=262177 RepID=Y011_NPVOP|nr:hypothetical protein OpmnVgp011 [Orgyia pseudotsugata multiple nucleopolyhedrovirus]Q65359.1 RecName: Full=Uncharacterized 37.2 kDa protein; AltName: Full=ORF11 [Orgyia pseudotsugata multiple nucleopolyhedrovirus]pir/T10280/ hypothetical protein - Orgyia pseudotsugata nuclear polyhedrosis virus [Orgyia pseudotsugata single capsid nuclopolyhedrovirus]AAC59010.1 unknown [Orgyia pseudotsugata multiple nucleopolyhedrovirus]BAA04168.1 ORF 10 [Orgyia pseudotsugata single capsid nuclopolyhedrovirus
MSLSSKLLVYAYYGSYNLPHDRYGESYHLYRIVHEHLTNTYVSNASCVRRDIATARCLNSGHLCFDVARQLLDVSEVAARLSAWFRCGDATGLCADMQRALADIDRHAPLARRVGRRANIFALDAIADIPSDVTNNLQGIIGRFMHFPRCSGLARVADVFDPDIRADGWWYHKFCVLTYMHLVACGAVPAGSATRLRDAVAKHIGPNDEGNCAPAIAAVYGRFCAIGREHFAHHKTACMHILFQFMRNDLTPADERHPCFGVIKDFGRQCKDTYTDLRTHADALYIHGTTDRQKNALFDLLCCVNASDIDADCYDCVVNKFYATQNKKYKM